MPEYSPFTTAPPVVARCHSCPSADAALGGVLDLIEIIRMRGSLRRTYAHSYAGHAGIVVLHSIDKIRFMGQGQNADGQVQPTLLRRLHLADLETILAGG